MNKLSVMMLSGAVISILFSCANAQAQITTVPACDIDKTIPNCTKPNGWALQIDTPVEHGAYVFVANPGCYEATNKILQDAIQAAIAALKPELAQVSGALSVGAAGLLGKAIQSSGGDIAKIISPYAKDGAQCVPQIGIIPVASTDVGFRYLATEQGKPFDPVASICKAGAECPVQYGAFDNIPIDKTNGEGVRTVTSIFKNWSHDRGRVARLLVFYNLPDGKAPIIER